MSAIDEFSDEDSFAPMADATHCQCCGGKTASDAYCIACHHPSNEWCARGDGKCPNCGYMIDNEGKCSHCGHQRTRENTEVKATHCYYCGSMLSVKGVCMNKESHKQAVS